MTGALGEGTRRFLYRWALPLAIAIACSAIADEAVDRSDWLNRQNSESVGDALSRSPIAPSKSIVVVTVDPDTQARLVEAKFGPKFGRQMVGKALLEFRKAGARVVVVDFEFTRSVPAADADLAAAIASCPPMRLTLGRGPPKAIEGGDDEPDSDRCSFPPLAAPLELASQNLYIGSMYPFEVGGELEGFAPIRIDHTTGRPILHCALSALIQFRGGDPREARLDLTGSILSANGLEWNLSQSRIFFVRPLTPGTNFVTLPLDEALRSPDRLRDKIVVLGGTDAYSMAGQPILGSEFVARGISTLLLGASKQLTAVPNAVQWAEWLALAALAASGMLAGRVWIAAVGVGSAVALALAAPGLASAVHYRFELVSTLTAVGLTFLLSTAVVLTIGRAEDFRPAGLEEEATAMFVDVKGSTEIVERIGPSAYQELHRRVNRTILRCVRRHGGILERTTGDGALCVFRGSARGHHAKRAVEAAIALSSSGGNADATGRPAGEVAFSIGIESGIVSGGYVVEGGRKSWSSAGSTVNLAQRLQGACATMNQPVLLGPTIASLVRHRVKLNPAGSFLPKGFSSEVHVFALG